MVWSAGDVNQDTSRWTRVWQGDDSGLATAVRREMRLELNFVSDDLDKRTIPRVGPARSLRSQGALKTRPS
jgi:hypothetical protein